MSKTRYKISSEHKKSAYEEQKWSKALSNGKEVFVLVGNLYRWAEFFIYLDENEKQELLEENSIVVNEYENFELIEMMDGGCDFWVDIINEKEYTEEELKEINNLLYKWPENSDSNYYDLEDEGYSEEKMLLNNWTETDCEYVLHSPYVLVADNN